MKVALMTIGDELLNGQTVDTNSAWLGRTLNKAGIQVVSKLSVADDEDSIVEGLNFSYRHADFVIVTGGLGPTKDDITKRVVANYFDDKLTFDEETYSRIKSYFNRTGREPTEAHKQQSFMPSSAELLLNDRGTAPGMWMYRKGKYLLSMPGVPSEMKGIMENQGLHKISKLNPEQHIQHYIIQTAGIGESFIANRIESIVESFPKELKMAYLPGLGAVKLRITAMGKDPKYLSDQIEIYGKQIIDLLGNAAVSIGPAKLEEVIGNQAKEKNITISTAESCTGGQISQLITSIPGSSTYFKGSIVAYSNQIKIKQLNVSPLTLESFGAVSEETVKEMVIGATKNLSTDVAIAVSGIAGPGGGSPEKPVGTIWIAVGNDSRLITKKLQLVKNRQLNVAYTAVAALNLLRLYLLNE